MRAVLFDLDDTLFDHRHSARSALIGLQRDHADLARVPIGELEARYSDALESIHVVLLRGEIDQREARTRRMQTLFDGFGIELDGPSARDVYAAFRRDYDAACRVVAGSHELLRAILARGLRLGVVTNNLVSEQVPKLRELDLTDYFDAVVISEAVGISKPDPRIFHHALEALGLEADDVVMVGDSLSSDVEGAVRAGIRPVWLRRDPSHPGAAPDGVAVIDRDFGDTSASLNAILTAPSN